MCRAESGGARGGEIKNRINVSELSCHPKGVSSTPTLASSSSLSRKSRMPFIIHDELLSPGCTRAEMTMLGRRSPMLGNYV